MIITNIIIIKKLEILQELPKCDKETQSEQMLFNRIAQYRVATNLQLVIKHNICEEQ